MVSRTLVNAARRAHEESEELLEEMVDRASKKEGRKAAKDRAYVSEDEAYQLNPDGVHSVIDDLSDYCYSWNMKSARSASQERDVLYFLDRNNAYVHNSFPSNVNQLEKQCAILTRTNTDNSFSAWKVLAVVAEEKDGSNPRLFIYHHRGLFANPETLYNIGERYEAKQALAER